jgi:deoxyribodipyrimidine photolyase
MEVLMGSKNGFLTKRLKGYSEDRNNPLKPRGLSGVSPYLHFGQISAQRCALEARRVRNLCPQVCCVKSQLHCLAFIDFHGIGIKINKNGF